MTGAYEQLEKDRVEAAKERREIVQSTGELARVAREQGLLLDGIAEHQAGLEQSLASLHTKIDALQTPPAEPPVDPPVARPPAEPPVKPPVVYQAPKLLGTHKITGTEHTFRWGDTGGQVNLEVGTSQGAHDVYWQEDPIEGEAIALDDLPRVSVLHARLWHRETEQDEWSYTDYKLATDYVAPKTARWPMDARTCDFRTKYNALAGFALMRQGLAYVDNFRFRFGRDGRVAKVTNQAQFDAARNNPDIGVIEWQGSAPVVVLDRRRQHAAVQLLVCEDLSHVRTWGNLAIDCQRVSRPQGSAYNVVAHGSNVLRSLPAGLAVTNNDWGSVAIEPVSEAVVRNVVAQGGVDFNEYASGRETVDFAFGAWQGNWSSHWDKGVRRPFDMSTEGCGMQGSVSINPGADTMQTVVMPDWLEPGKPNHPHGKIDHARVFALGVIAGITRDKWLTGQGEQAFDFKSGRGVEVADCLTSGFAQNHVGDNSAHGDGLVGTHFYVDDVKASRCVGHNQRAAEFGSGERNMVEECLFTDPSALNDLAKAKGLRPSGAFGLVGYRETRYPWATPGLKTAVQARGNVFDHAPRHSMGKGVPFDNQGELVVDKARNVFADFGPLGRLVIGTTDPKAKDTIWFAG